MWEPLNGYWQKRMERGEKAAPALAEAIAELRETMEKGWGVPQKYAATMREIWVLQPQFDNRRGARPHRLLAQARFRAAYDFLMLRAQLGQAARELADWWTTFQHADETERAAMTAAAPQNPHEGTKKRRRPRKRKKSGNAAAEA